MKVMPAMTSAMSLLALSRRKRFWAFCASSNTLVSVATRVPQPLLLQARRRMVANRLSIGLVVRR